MDVARPAAWVPDRPPTWSELLLTVASLFMIGGLFRTLPYVSWPAVAAGSVGAVAVMGPFAATTYGRRLDDWGRRIGGRKKIAVVAGFAVALGLAPTLSVVPVAFVTNFAAGILLGTAVYVVAHLAAARSVSGWRPA
jgi:phage shock protein PspC (stress-responsive transcriptional regulator)